MGSGFRFLAVLRVSQSSQGVPRFSPPGEGKLGGLDPPPPGKCLRDSKLEAATLRALQHNCIAL
eukprot:1428602-Pyramimonas_sp.AAC.1